MVTTQLLCQCWNTPALCAQLITWCVLVTRVLGVQNMFAEGQTYVALSRVRSMEGLQILDSSPDCVKVTPPPPPPPPPHPTPPHPRHAGLQLAPVTKAAKNAAESESHELACSQVSGGLMESASHWAASSCSCAMCIGHCYIGRWPVQLKIPMKVDRGIGS